MSARQSIVVYLVLVTLSGALSGYLGTATHPHAATAAFALLLLGTVAPYVWFYLDAAERGFRRTYRWSTGIILLSFFAVPLYLAHSRPAGHRLKAVGKALGVLALSALLPALAQVPFELANGHMALSSGRHFTAPPASSSALAASMRSDRATAASFMTSIKKSLGS